MKEVELSKKLISFKTVTPEDAGIINFISNLLQKELNFKEVIIKKFTDANEKAKDTLNMYASLFKPTPESKNFCFAGHVDVVPEGKEYLWKFPPFEPTIEDGILYGRGASDMKTAIASFIIAVQEFLEERKNFNKGNISILLTCDEEGDAINGTQKMLKFIESINIKLNHVLVGEPTSEVKVGDVTKNGRRGSVSFTLTVEGKQGHIAYPHLATNPVHEVIKLAGVLSSLKLDEGAEGFLPSSLQIVRLSPEYGADNVIPNFSSCFFNIRFNSLHTGESLKKYITNIIQQNTNLKFKLNTVISGEAFLTKDEKFENIVKKSIKEITNINSHLSTSGGTSDARFIKNYANVLELGMLNKTAHQIDESVSTSDITTLKNIYKQILHNYFFI